MFVTSRAAVRWAARPVGVFALMCALASAGCGRANSATAPEQMENDEPSELELIIGAGLLQMNVGDVVPINATVSVTGATRVYSVSYESTNQGVTTVSPDGVVTAIAAGEAMINVTATLVDSGVSDSASLGVHVSTLGDGVAELVSSATFANLAIDSQTTSFQLDFDATPSADEIDAVTGLSAGDADAFADLAVTVRFNTQGFIDVRNGGAYDAPPYRS